MAKTKSYKVVAQIYNIYIYIKHAIYKDINEI